MAESIVHRPAGPTYALSVTNTQHAAVAVTNFSNDVVPYAAFTNPGSVAVCVAVYQLSQTGGAQQPTLVFPVDGTPTTITSFLLPPLMEVPIVLAVPTGNDGFSVTAIGAAAGPTIIYVTPVVAQ